MNKFLLAILLICSSIKTFAQSDITLQTESVSVKVELPPAVKEITSSNKYTIVSPERLKYHVSTKEIEEINWLGKSLDLEGKKVRKPEEADYIFQLSSDGIIINPSSPVATTGGYVYNFKCSFPVTLKVINKQGTVEKIFNFNSDPIEWTYHTNFLLEPFRTEDWTPKKKIVPFVNADSAANNFKRNETAIYKRIEFNAWFYTIEFAKKVLSLSYNSTKLTPSQYYFKFTNKKGVEANKELTDEIKKQTTLIKKLGDEKTFLATVEALRSGQKYLDGIATDLSKFSTNFKKMILSSAALGALFGTNHEKASDYFLQYFKLEENNESDLFWSFRSAYNDVRNWNIARKETIEVKPIEDVSFLYVK